MAENKDENYNSTNQAMQSKSTCCGVAAVPHVQYHSGVVCTICPNCKSVGPTNVESSWNIKSYLCCYYCGLYWWCYHTIKGKDYTFKNGVHTCSNCNSLISTYESC